MKQTNVPRHGNAFRFSASPLQALHVGKVAANRLLNQDVHARHQGSFGNRHVGIRVRRDHKGVSDFSLNQFLDRAEDVRHAKFAGQSFRLRTVSIPKRDQLGFGKSAKRSGVQRPERTHADNRNFDWLFHSDGVDLTMDFPARRSRTSRSAAL